MKSHLHVVQRVSSIGNDEKTRRVLVGLGLRRRGSAVTVANTPSFRGMVKKVLHLVSVVEVDGPAQ